jgi:hypothetical protein
MKKSEPMDITGDDADSEHRKHQKQLYHIRHKLQKLVYEKKPVSNWILCGEGMGGLQRLTH